MRLMRRCQVNLSLLVQIPSPYAAMPAGWPQQQQQQVQQQQQQQQGMPGHGQPPMQYPYPPFMPMLLPYGMPPPMQGMPAGPFRVHVAGAHHPGAAQGPPNAGQIPMSQSAASTPELPKLACRTYCCEVHHDLTHRSNLLIAMPGNCSTATFLQLFSYAAYAGAYAP